MADIEKNSNLGLKIAVVVLLLIVIGGVIYNLQIIENSNQIKTDLDLKISEKETLLKDLNQLKKSYDVAIAENASMAEQLIVERAKIIELIKDVERSKGETKKFKDLYSKYDNQLKTLISENEILKIQKEASLAKIDSTSKALSLSKQMNSSLESKNEKLTKTLEKGSKISIVSINTSTFKVRSSGKELPTDKANSVDVLKISYTIAENKIATSEEKEFYIQVIDSDGNVIGKKESVKIGDISLKYSLISKAKYDTKTLIVNEKISGEPFRKGTYFVNLFDKKELILSKTFILK